VGVHNERRRSIIIWGPPGSGKSLYLTSLVLWLTREPNERPLAVLPASDATAQWLARRSTAHPEGLALTDAGAPPADLLFRVYSMSDAPDPAGFRSSLVAELTPSDAVAREASPRGLADAAGVMLLLPAATMATSRESRDACISWFTTTLARLPEQLGAPPTVSLPVAVCLTQTDEAPDAVRRDATQWLESFGSETLSALRAHCANFSVFKVSATGRAPRRRDDVDVIVGSPEPRGVLAPIRWILDAGATEAAA
jgi:hypothetical protein